MQRELVERAKRGDADAFTQLVMASAPRLAGVAHLILRDHDRAKDAVQEACISAWKYVRALRDPDAWDAWLRRLTVRASFVVESPIARVATLAVTTLLLALLSVGALVADAQSPSPTQPEPQAPSFFSGTQAEAPGGACQLASPTVESSVT